MGGGVLHGAWLEGCSGLGSPVRQAFEDWGVAGKGRSSWDPIAVLIAVRGANGIFCQEVNDGQGYNEVDEAGHETWHNDGHNHNQSRIAYMNSEFDVRDKISFEINELLCKLPGNWSKIDWFRAESFNCWPNHGATDIAGSPVGQMSVSSCQQTCLELAGGACTGVVTTPSGKSDDVNCYLKKDIVLGKCDTHTTFDTWIRRDWVAATGFNCWSGHGATDIDGSTPCGRMDVRACQRRCENTENCDAIVWKGDDHSGFGDCYRKSRTQLHECDSGTDFDTYVRA